MRLVVTDIETTGISPADGAEIIEIAWVVLKDDGPDEMTRGKGPFEWDDHQSHLCKPERAIPYDMSAVHHLLAEDFEHPGCLTAQEALTLYSMVKGVRVAHNANFEAAFLDHVNGYSYRWLCTFKAAKRLWPDLSSHSNQAIRYRLGLVRPFGLDREPLMKVHRALPDTIVTAAIVADMIEAGVSVDDMLSWTLQPTYIPTCPLKKYKGKKWADVPTDYLEWMARASDMDPDLLHWARAELARR